MSDIARFGLPIAVLIAAAVTCFLIAFAPTAHTPGPDRMTGQVHVNGVVTVPYKPHTGEAVTADA